jgi:hypothetical protein
VILGKIVVFPYRFLYKERDEYSSNMNAMHRQAKRSIANFVNRENFKFEYITYLSKESIA